MTRLAERLPGAVAYQVIGVVVASCPGPVVGVVRLCQPVQPIVLVVDHPVGGLQLTRRGSRLRKQNPAWLSLCWIMASLSTKIASVRSHFCQIRCCHSSITGLNDVYGSKVSSKTHPLLIFVMRCTHGSSESISGAEPRITIL
jgi:hypothetical protein